MRRERRNTVALARMIKFPCHCSYVFTVEDNMAGSLIQCPKCQRLNDVPRLSDLAGLDQDGTIRLLEEPEPDDPDRLVVLERVFAKTRIDADGNEIDLRNSIDDLRDAGSEEVPLELADAVRPSRPKYDPVTGELVRAIDIEPGPERIDPKTVPFATPVMGYAKGHTADHHPRTHAFIEMLRPINMLVMLFIFMMHLVMAASFMTGQLIFLLVPFIVLIAIGLLAHYGNVIDEVGPNDQDELPRPLRSLSMRDDIWHPFTHMIVALVLCFGPGILLGQLLAWPTNMVSWIALAVGFVLFPAFFLTASTSGDWANLSPNRAGSVIGTSPGRYISALVILLPALFFYAVGMAGVQANLASLFTLGGLKIPIYFRGVFALPTLLVGIYLMHVFCWSLGIIYRKHHEEFAWVNQRHVRTTPASPASKVAAPVTASGGRASSGAKRVSS